MVFEYLVFVRVGTRIEILMKDICILIHKITPLTYIGKLGTDLAD